MTIDWSQTAVYNTIMSIAVGLSLILILKFISLIYKEKVNNLEGWIFAFGLLGFILTITGLHMTLTWPLSKIGFPFDDIIFGEPSLAFGSILIILTLILWRRLKVYERSGFNLFDGKTIANNLLNDLPKILKPVSYFGAAMGGALIAIAIAGVTFQLFAAPPEEPISGLFADYPLIEATFISGLYALVGVGAIIFPFIIEKFQYSRWAKIVKWVWFIAGVLFLIFGIMNYFTHIGLIVNTSK